MDRISEWCSSWRRSINVKKCVHVRFIIKRCPISSNYIVNVEIIKTESNVKYLSVMMSSDLTWKAHVDMIDLKAVRMLNFIRQNFWQGSSKIKENLYFTFIRPCMEYASIVWDPHYNNLIDKLEKLQNQCARFVLNNYQLEVSVTSMMGPLDWGALRERRKSFRLKFLDNIYQNHLLSRDTFLHDSFKYREI